MMSLRRALATYRPSPGDHLCSLWTDAGADAANALAFLSAGMARGDGALWITDRRPTGEGPTHPVPIADVNRLYGGTDGRAALHRILEAWTAACGRCPGSGFRIVSDMLWTLRAEAADRISGDQVIRHESGLNGRFTDLGLSVICRYASLGLPPAMALGLIRAHPALLIGRYVYDNPFFVRASGFSDRERHGDPLESLTPMWRYFVTQMPDAPSLFDYVVNSLPSLIPADAVAIQATSHHVHQTKTYLQPAGARMAAIPPAESLTEYDQPIVLKQSDVWCCAERLRCASGNVSIALWRAGKELSSSEQTRFAGLLAEVDQALSALQRAAKYMPPAS